MKSKVKRPRSIQAKKRKFRLNSFNFSLKFFLVTFIIFLKVALEIIIEEDFDFKNRLFLMLYFTFLIVFFILFLYLDFISLNRSCGIIRKLKSFLISLAIISGTFLIIYFRSFSEIAFNNNENYRVAQIYWDSQALCFFSFILAKTLPFRHKILLFFVVNSMVLILFTYQNSSYREVGLSILNFLPNILIFSMNIKDFLKFFDSNDPNLEEICGFISQSLMILSKDSNEILYVSPHFSASISKLKSLKGFDDVNDNLHDFEEEKILVDRCEDQQSIIASLNRNSLSPSLGSKHKFKSCLLNTSRASKNRSKFKRLKELLDSNEEKFEFFLEKNIIRTYLVHNSAQEQKELHIKNVRYKKKLCYCIYLENAEKINVLANLSKENEFQSRLLSSFSHEMRTPLNGSLPILQDILENLKPCCKSSLQDNVFTALGSLKLLENTINDIIDFQALHSGEFYLNIQEINLKEVFQNVINLMQVQAERKGLAFKVKIDNDIPELIMSDGNRIQQLLINLLSNAIKFTIKGFVEIHAKIQKKTPELLIQIQIKDTGIGIEDDKMKKMHKILTDFEIEKMQFLESTGCSFGIILSQNLAMALGSEEQGGLTVETKLNEGSCFTFYIVDREDQKKISDIVDSRACSLNVISANLEKNSESRLTNKTRKSLASNASPQLKKLRETTYQKIKTDIFMMGDEFGEDDSVIDTPHHYLSQKIILINESISQKGKHFIVNSNNNSPSKNDSMKISSRKQEKETTNERTNIQTQGSVHECTCNKILVVDDCIFNIKTMELLLKKEGLKCDSAFDAFEAIEKFKNKFILKTSICGPKCLAYRLIIMDYQMPKKDGVQAAIELQELIKDYKLADIPIICCTAFDSNSLVTKCFQAGMKEVIFKPLNVSVLRNVLRKWLK